MTKAKIWVTTGDQLWSLTVTPEGNRPTYKWGSKIIDHFFRPTCGCATYGASSASMRGYLTTLI